MNILKVDKLTNFKYLNLFSVQYKDKAEKLKSWIFASRSEKPDVMFKIDGLGSKSDSNLKSNIKGEKRPNAVVIVPFHIEHNKLVIIKEFRIALGEYQYGLPAGLMDKGESVEETAERELKEETGLEVVNILKISPVIYSSSGMTDESIVLVYVECRGEPSTKWNEESEDITVIMVSAKEAQDLLKTCRIKFDVKSWLILSAFANNSII